MHGYGVITYEDGRVFKGYFYNDKRHGLGEYSNATGTKIEGTYEHGILSNGKITWPDGTSYIGELMSGKPHG